MKWGRITESDQGWEVFGQVGFVYLEFSGVKNYKFLVSITRKLYIFLWLETNFFATYLSNQKLPKSYFKIKTFHTFLFYNLLPTRLLKSRLNFHTKLANTNPSPTLPPKIPYPFALLKKPQSNPKKPRMHALPKLSRRFRSRSPAVRGTRLQNKQKWQRSLWLSKNRWGE